MTLSSTPLTFQKALEDMIKYAPVWLSDEVENCVEEANTWDEAKLSIDNSLSDLIQEISKVRKVLTDMPSDQIDLNGFCSDVMP